MSQVGSGFGMFRDNRRAIPQPKNPLDKSTIVSLLPKEIYAVKHTIYPGIFRIAPAPKDGYSLLTVGASSWWKDVDPQTPLLEIPESSLTVAKAICDDFLNGILGCNMGDKKPGLFYIPGEWNVNNILEAKGEASGIKWSFVSMLAEAKANQRRWYIELVSMADVLWARSNGNPLSISDDARYGAEILNMKNKPWLKDTQTLQLDNCPACGALVNMAFPICGNCKYVVNKAKANELGIAS